MIGPTSLFNLPFLILMWLTEMYLFLACTRLVVSRIPGASQSQFCQQLKLLADFLPHAVGRRLPLARDGSSPNWLAWSIVLVSGFMLRQILIVIITG